MELKKPITFEAQIEKLKARGCIITDETFSKMKLQQINYYRFSAYFLPFRDKNGNYISGTSFETVYRIYEFDRKLRSLLFSIIEEIELMLRTQLSYYHAHKYGELGYLNSKNFNSKHNHEEFLKHIADAIRNNKNQYFVKHHINNYDSKFPIWVIIELFSAGELSFFFSDLLRPDKKAIAQSLFHANDSNTHSWLWCLSIIRNYCAHYARLYYNHFFIIPATPKNMSYTLHDQVFDYILVLKFLYPDAMAWKQIFLTGLCTLIEEYRGAIDLDCIGFPENWLQLLREPNPRLRNG